MTVKNIVVAGLGGQGVLKVTDILADALFLCGYNVKKSEVHGMSQRGGSVSSEVRFGDRVASPMVPMGECDILAVLDTTQVEVVRAKMRPDGILITPDNVPKDQLKHPKALNTMILGAIAKHLDVKQEIWDQALSAAIPEKLLELNKEMFALGRK